MATKIKDAPKRAKQHQIYRLKDGTRVPGVTTITGVEAKPFLIPWANKLGLQGIKTAEYVDHLAEIGTLAHQMVADHLRGKVTDTSEYTGEQIDKAENSFLSYLEWEKGKTIEPILIEIPLVSEKYRYGGQIDTLLKVNCVLGQYDLKTGKAIYDDWYTQLIAYAYLLFENGYIEDWSNLPSNILRIGRDETEGFEVGYGHHHELFFRKFLDLLDVHQVNKEIKRNE